MDMNEMLEYTLINYRWVLVILFLLPLSAAHKIYNIVRNSLVFKFNIASLRHDKAVRDVQRQVKEWNKTSMDKKMCTARPGWQTMSFRRGLYKDTMFNVSVNLQDILHLNVEKKFVRVEPLVTMGQLSRTINPLGWTIPVVPELDDLTVGGLVMGTGVESSSHKYGLFQHICRAFEIVLSDGSVVKCSREENSDLFYAIPWSHGTIGFLVSVDIDIIHALKYVKLHYKPVYSLKEAADTFQKESHNMDNDFVEGLMFTRERGVIMTGVMTDDSESDKVNAISLWYKPWFFKHVEKKLDKTNKNEEDFEYIPLRDYFHRHTRALFWEIQEIVPFANNLIFRFLLGWVMPPKVSFLKLTQSNAIKKLYERQHMIQDLLIPIEKVEEAIGVFHKEVEIYPIWLCPFKLTSEPSFAKNNSPSSMYVDVGLYGVPKTSNFHARDTHRRIEKYVSDIGGYQMLYADTYTTREEFRNMFDHTLYDKMRKSLNAEKAFPEVYDKVNKTVRT